MCIRDRTSTSCSKSRLEHHTSNDRPHSLLSIVQCHSLRCAIKDSIACDLKSSDHRVSWVRDHCNCYWHGCPCQRFQPVMLNEAVISRPRPMPRPGSTPEAEAEINYFLRSRQRKYQMFTDSIRRNLIIYIIMIRTTQFNFSCSLAK